MNQELENLNREEMLDNSVLLNPELDNQQELQNPTNSIPQGLRQTLMSYSTPKDIYVLYRSALSSDEGQDFITTSNYIYDDELKARQSDINKYLLEYAGKSSEGIQTLNVALYKCIDLRNDDNKNFRSDFNEHHRNDSYSSLLEKGWQSHATFTTAGTIYVIYGCRNTSGDYIPWEDGYIWTKAEKAGTQAALNIINQAGIATIYATGYTEQPKQPTGGEYDFDKGQVENVKWVDSNGTDIKYKFKYDASSDTNIWYSTRVFNSITNDSSLWSTPIRIITGKELLDTIKGSYREPKTIYYITEDKNDEPTIDSIKNVYYNPNNGKWIKINDGEETEYNFDDEWVLYFNYKENKDKYIWYTERVFVYDIKTEKLSAVSDWSQPRLITENIADKLNNTLSNFKYLPITLYKLCESTPDKPNATYNFGTNKIVFKDKDGNPEVTIPEDSMNYGWTRDVPEGILKAWYTENAFTLYDNEVKDNGWSGPYEWTNHKDLYNLIISNTNNTISSYLKAIEDGKNVSDILIDRKNEILDQIAAIRDLLKAKSDEFDSFSNKTTLDIDTKSKLLSNALDELHKLIENDNVAGLLGKLQLIKDENDSLYGWLGYSKDNSKNEETIFKKILQTISADGDFRTDITLAIFRKDSEIITNTVQDISSGLITSEIDGIKYKVIKEEILDITSPDHDITLHIQFKNAKYKLTIENIEKLNVLICIKDKEGINDVRTIEDTVFTSEKNDCMYLLEISKKNPDDQINETKVTILYEYLDYITLQTIGENGIVNTAIKKEDLENGSDISQTISKISSDAIKNEVKRIETLEGKVSKNETDIKLTSDAISSLLTSIEDEIIYGPTNLVSNPISIQIKDKGEYTIKATHKNSNENFSIKIKYIISDVSYEEGQLSIDDQEWIEIKEDTETPVCKETVSIEANKEANKYIIIKNISTYKNPITGETETPDITVSILLTLSNKLTSIVTTADGIIASIFDNGRLSTLEANANRVYSEVFQEDGNWDEYSRINLLADAIELNTTKILEGNQIEGKASELNDTQTLTLKFKKSDNPSLRFIIKNGNKKLPLKENRFKIAFIKEDESISDEYDSDKINIDNYKNYIIWNGDNSGTINFRLEFGDNFNSDLTIIILECLVKTAIELLLPENITSSLMSGGEIVNAITQSIEKNSNTISLLAKTINASGELHVENLYVEDKTSNTQDAYITKICGSNEIYTEDESEESGYKFNGDAKLVEIGKNTLGESYFRADGFGSLAGGAILWGLGEFTINNAGELEFTPKGLDDTRSILNLGIKGHIFAEAGTVGGWTITEDDILKSNGSNIIRVSPKDGIVIALNIGNQNHSIACLDTEGNLSLGNSAHKFYKDGNFNLANGSIKYENEDNNHYLTVEGIVKAKGGEIGGWTIADGGLVYEQQKQLTAEPEDPSDEIEIALASGISQDQDTPPETGNDEDTTIASSISITPKTGIQIQAGNKMTTLISPDGTGHFASGKFKWDLDNVEVEGSIKASKFELTKIGDGGNGYITITRFDPDEHGEAPDNSGIEENDPVIIVYYIKNEGNITKEEKWIQKFCDFSSSQSIFNYKLANNFDNVYYTTGSLAKGIFYTGINSSGSTYTEDNETIYFTGTPFKKVNDNFYLIYKYFTQENEYSSYIYYNYIYILHNRRLFTINDTYSEFNNLSFSSSSGYNTPFVKISEGGYIYKCKDLKFTEGKLSESLKEGFYYLNKSRVNGVYHVLEIGNFSKNYGIVDYLSDNTLSALTANTNDSNNMGYVILPININEDYSDKVLLPHDEITNSNIICTNKKYTNINNWNNEFQNNNILFLIDDLVAKDILGYFKSLNDNYKDYIIGGQSISNGNISMYTKNMLIAINDFNIPYNNGHDRKISGRPFLRYPINTDKIRKGTDNGYGEATAEFTASDLSVSNVNQIIQCVWNYIDLFTVENSKLLIILCPELKKIQICHLDFEDVLTLYYINTTHFCIQS